MRRSIDRVAHHREVILSPLKSILQDYEGIAHPRWLAWLKKQRLDAARRWLSTNRSPLALHWNLFTGLTVNQLNGGSSSSRKVSSSSAPTRCQQIGSRFILSR